MNQRFSLILLALLSLLPAAAPASGLEPRLVKDINQVPSPASSFPQRLVALGNVALFNANDGLSGRELWRSDGTAGGTYQLADICPGPCSSTPDFGSVGGGLYFFLAATSESHRELWVTDGTPGGTQKLWAPLGGLGRGVWVPEQEALYFWATDAFSGDQLWRSDGTPAGTFMVAALHPNRDSDPQEITAFQGRVWFVADDGNRGNSLWVSDGTEQGATLFFDPAPSAGVHSGPRFLRVVGNRLIFAAPDGKRGEQLWASDGTARGTVPLVRAARGRFHFSRVQGNRLYFVAEDARQGQELWVTDGTVQGTKTLTAFAPKKAFALGGLADAPVAGRLLFWADDGSRGLELWSTDGTRKGTRLVRDLCKGACSGVRDILGVHLGLLWIRGAAGGQGDEVWVTDGTGPGTRLVGDLCPGRCSSDPLRVGPAGDRMLFAAKDAEAGYQLWSSDGTPAGTVPIGDLDAVVDWLPDSRVALPGRIVFSGADDLHGMEPWTSDGTPGGTHLLRDVHDADVGGSDPGSLQALGDAALFFADDGIHGFELWKSDGTEAGTSLVAELVAGKAPAERPAIWSSAVAGGKLFFAAHKQVWRTDGTAAGTLQLAGPISAFRFQAVGDRVFFDADDGRLWVSDGTPAGTRLVGDTEGFLVFPVEFQGRLYFTRKLGDRWELWRSDGTDAGTVRVEDLGLFPFGEGPWLAVHAGSLWYFAHGTELRRGDGTGPGTVQEVSLEPHFVISTGPKLLVSNLDGLWSTDGTAAGTHLVGPPWYRFYQLAAWTVFRERFYYVAADPSNPGLMAVWVSDGTPEGTHHLLPGPALDFAPLGDRLLFTQQDGLLWQTNGTAAGTLPVRDLDPGSSLELVRAGARVFFPAPDPATGTELWAVEP
ncbi:MAG TPA: hypothetical protein VF179_24005 [Thermoanaerobaculia bacterium]|nr:hypothetical protein [Thermoanaerobaculia bacterium]